MEGTRVNTMKLLKQVLNAFGSFLQLTEADVQLVRVTEDGIVEVRLLGSCVGCPMSVMTLRAGIERSLMIQNPDVRRVEQVK